MSKKSKKQVEEKAIESEEKVVEQLPEPEARTEEEIETEELKAEPFDFEVKRERLMGPNNIDTHTDLIYRPDTSTSLGIVSEDYQLVTHKDVVGTINEIISELKLAPEVERSGVTKGGARLYHSLVFPTMRWEPRVGDKFDPVITVVNSYDRTRSLGLVFGTKRLSCSNGAWIFDRDFNYSMRHAYNKIDLSAAAGSLREAMKVAVELTTAGVQRLLELAGVDFLKKMIDLSHHEFSLKCKEVALAELKEFVEIERSEKGKIEGFQVKVADGFTAYEVWNAMTKASTHSIGAAAKRMDTDRLITRLFFPKVRRAF